MAEGEKELQVIVHQEPGKITWNFDDKKPFFMNPPVDVVNSMSSVVKTESRAPEKPTEAVKPVPKAENKHDTWQIIFTGNEQQLRKVLGYISFVGAKYEVERWN